MLYKAVVIDNSMIFTRGTIRVRIAGLYNRNIIWDLQDRFPGTVEEGEREDGTQFSNDFEAKLSSAFGGGRNYGSLVIPQPNEKGLVAFLGNSKKYPVWLGGLFETKRNDDFDVEFVNFPSDNFQEGTNTDGVVGEESLIGDDIEPQEDKSIILRTKHTNINSVEEIDFQEQNTSNIISLGKQRVRLTHFPEDSWVVNEDESQEGDDENDPVIVKDYFKYKDFLIGKDEEGNETFRYEDKALPTQDEADNGQGDINSRLEINQEKIELIKENINEEEPKSSYLLINDQKIELKDFKKVDDKELSSTIVFEGNEFKVSRINEDEELETSLVLNETEGSMTLSKEGEEKAKMILTETGVEIQNNTGANKIIFNDSDEIIIENDSGSTIKMLSNGNIELMPNNEFHVLGDSDNLVRYADLKAVIEAFETHLHVAPSGPTTPPLTSSQAPIVSDTLKPSIDMKSIKGKIK